MSEPDFKIVDPVTIGDANFIRSNIIEDLPRSTSGVSYAGWSAATTYAADEVVCWVYSDIYDPEAGVQFGVFTSLYGTNKNREPAKVWPFGGGTLPGYNYWRLERAVPAWSSGDYYAVGAIVGRISGGTGAFYQSLVANNHGNDPASSPGQWRQTTADSYETYAGGTTYALDDIVAMFQGTYATVFRSLQNSNTGHSPDSSPLWWEYLGETWKSWSTGTSYGQGDIVIDLRTHHRYESAGGSNLDHDPTIDDGSNWIDLGATNSRAMFDTSNTSQTSFGDEIDFTVQPNTLCDAVALINMTAQQVQVIATSVSGGGEVYNETFDLVDPSFITDWRKYFFDPITYRADLVLTDLPPFVDLMIRVIITNDGGIASCGTAVFGWTTSLGVTLKGAEGGIISYSKKTADDLGEYTFVKRASSKRADFKVAVDREQVDAVYNMLVAREATLCLFIGTDGFAMTWIFGFYRDFTVALEEYLVSYLSIQVEGMT